ncbi:MAG: hypothetical protein M3133_08220 [Actinomycetota bacterium]|nr:hypothetical protein [Actinomycetota bacterium]
MRRVVLGRGGRFEGAASGRRGEELTVPTLDEWITGLGSTGGMALALAVALLLGLRHATDPDHLTAVSTIVLSEDGRRGGGAGALGLAWGLGHALTVLLLGLPVVLAGHALPDAVHRAAEVAVGAVIVVLALRLLLRWRRGYLHLHPHAHGGLVHAHPHAHEHPRRAGHPSRHYHAHADALGRTPLAAFGVGLLHGVGGSAGAGILVVGTLETGLAAAAALLLFAVGTAASMAVVSAAVGSALCRRPLSGRLAAAVPAFGAAGVLFGIWYTLGALEAVPYGL